jgi:hypothetical protein
MNPQSRKKCNQIVLSLTFLGSLFFANSGLAKEYKIEVLIFENNQPSIAYENYRYSPIAELNSEAPIWKLEPTMLVEARKALENAADYNLLYHYSWGQQTLPVSQAAVYQLFEENLKGWIKVYAGQLLFANIDLDLNGYRMTERRRLKLDEKHFFDHPKFGVLMQVSRLAQTSDEKIERELIDQDTAADEFSLPDE